MDEFLKLNKRVKLFCYYYESLDPRSGRCAVLSLYDGKNFKVDFITDNCGKFSISEISTTSDNIFQAVDIIRSVINAEENALSLKYGESYRKQVF